MFAKELNIKAWLDSPAYEEQKGVVKREVNRYPVKIDYKCFEKTPEEKLKLKVMKANWEARQDN